MDPLKQRRITDSIGGTLPAFHPNHSQDLVTLHRPQTQAGFTLLELLGVLIVLGILLAIVFPYAVGWQSRTNAESFVSNFASDIASSRASSLSSGVQRRIIIDSAKTYKVQQKDAAGTWSDLRSEKAPNSTFNLGATSALCLVFDTRGFMLSYSDVSCATTTTNTVYPILGGGITKQLLVTALGLVNRS